MHKSDRRVAAAVNGLGHPANVLWLLSGIATATAPLHGNTIQGIYESAFEDWHDSETAMLSAMRRGEGAGLLTVVTDKIGLTEKGLSMRAAFHAYLDGKRDSAGEDA